MSFLKEHPEVKDWLQRNVRGEPILYGWPQPTPERYLACLNSPSWIKHQKSVAKLAIDMGFDGIYFDNAFLGREACYCHFCKEKFRNYCTRELGQEHDLPTKPDWSNPVWQTFINFRYYILTAGLEQLREHVKSVNSEIIFMFNALPPPTDLRTATERTWGGVDPCRLAKIADLLYFECGDTFPRIEGQHLITNIETLKYGITAGKGQNITSKGYLPGRPLLTPHQIKLAVAEAAAFCCSFNAYNFTAMEEKPILEDTGARTALGEYNIFLEKNEEFYVDTESITDIAVLYSRPTQDWYCNDQNEHDYAHRRGFDQVLIDSYFLYDIIHDEDITGDFLSKYKVLVLPSVVCMSEEQIDRVKHFVEKGGGLVAIYKTSSYDENYKKRKSYGLAEIFGAHYNKTSYKPIRRKYGQGRVAFFPYHLDKDYWLSRQPKELKLLTDAVEWAAQKELSLKVKAPEGVLINLFRQEGRQLVHIVNYPSHKEAGRVVLVENMEIETRTTSKIEEVSLISPDFKDQKRLPYEIIFRNGTEFIKFVVPKVKIYTLIIISEGCL